MKVIDLRGRLRHDPSAAATRAARRAEIAIATALLVVGAIGLVVGVTSTSRTTEAGLGVLMLIFGAYTLRVALRGSGSR